MEPAAGLGTEPVGTVGPMGDRGEGGGAAHGPSAPPATTSPAAIDRLQGSWRWGRVFAAVWLVYLVPTAMDAWQNPHRPLRVLGLVALAAFSVVYMRSFWVIRR